MSRPTLELLITLGYFASCALLGLIAEWLFPLEYAGLPEPPLLMPPRLYAAYIMADGWVKYAFAFFLASFSILGVYARIDLKLDRKYSHA